MRNEIARAGQSVYVGADDWLHPQWCGVFYPDDMPVDWQLAYYATQFGCIWLPQTRWLAATAKEARQWVEDTPAGFRFLLERPVRMRPGGAGLLALLKPKLGAICPADAGRLLWFDGDTRLRDLPERIERGRHGSEPVYLLSRDGNLAGLERVRTLVALLGL